MRPRGGKEQEEMMGDRLYNPLKLSVYRPLFSGKRVLICGAGVGMFLYNRRHGAAHP